MTERITIRNADSPEAIFLRALLKVCPVKNNGLYIDAELTINGIKVPVGPTIQAFEQGLEEVAKKMAAEMLSEKALQPLADALRAAQVGVKLAIAQLPKGDSA